MGLSPSTVTFRFFKYFSSILYGCLAPFVRRSVISKTFSDSASLDRGVGLSVEGPIAGAICSRLRGAAGAGSICWAKGMDVSVPIDSVFSTEAYCIDGESCGIGMDVRSSRGKVSEMVADFGALPAALGPRLLISNGVDELDVISGCWVANGFGTLSGLVKVVSADGLSSREAIVRIGKLWQTNRTSGLLRRQLRRGKKRKCKDVRTRH